MKRRNLSKKDLERWILDRFITAHKLGDNIKSIEFGDEPPDFVIQEPKRIISVEVTQLIRPRQKQRETFHEDLVETARLKFKERYDANLRVLVNFSSAPIKCKASELHRYVDDLASAVEKIFLANREFLFQWSSREVKRPFNHFIDSLAVSQDKDFENWQPFGAYRVDYIDMEWLRQTILRKEADIPKYPFKFDEHWLLLAANFGHKSSAHRFDYLDHEQFNSVFDKVYLFSMMENICSVLKG